MQIAYDTGKLTLGCYRSIFRIDLFNHFFQAETKFYRVSNLVLDLMGRAFLSFSRGACEVDP
jgi:hypothetical protein